MELVRRSRPYVAVKRREMTESGFLVLKPCNISLTPLIFMSLFPARLTFPEAQTLLSFRDAYRTRDPNPIEGVPGPQSVPHPIAAPADQTTPGPSRAVLR